MIDSEGTKISLVLHIKFLSLHVIKHTVFPLVVLIWTSFPVIFETTPSIQDSSGSSTHTWDPTVIFTVACNHSIKTIINILQSNNAKWITTFNASFHNLSLSHTQSNNFYNRQCLIAHGSAMESPLTQHMCAQRIK